MKVAVSSTGPELTSPVDARFGRAAYFVIVDTETTATESVENRQNRNAAQGAGIQSASTVASSGAQAVLTGHCGPKAFRALRAAGIDVYTNVQGTVGQAVEQLKAGQLRVSEEADVDGHWA